MVTVLFLLSSCILAIQAANSRERMRMNFGWSFHLGSQDLQHASCTASSFVKKSNYGCEEFIEIPTVAKNDADACADACCANPTCALFQISSSGVCSLGNIISIYNAFNWKSTCKTENGNTFYSRETTQAIPDTNPAHFAPAAKDFDDSKWPIINLPHDFVVNGTFEQDTGEKEPRSGSHGSLPKNTSWYRKHISLPTEYQNSTLWIDFDGIYRNSIMFMNGIFLGNHSSGYTSFRYFLDSNKYALEFGSNSDNVLSIFVDATAEEGWWYEGGGIYRNVWFNKANKIYFEPKGGIYLPSNVSQVNSDGTTGTGNLIINATINNMNNMDQTINLKFDIIKPDGSILKTLTMNSVTIKAMSSITVAPSYSSENIQLWTLENPALYKVNATIMDSKNEEIDMVQERFGYRQAIFDPDKGLLLNGKNVKMAGFCNHQDFGGTGVATPERINRFRIEHLKNMGGNSWRMSHNPPNPELLDYADEYGFLIWDENRHFGDSPQWKQDQADMIIRDRNHPSIMIWSICNEAGCQSGSSGIDAIAEEFKGIIEKYDGIYGTPDNKKWGYSRPTAGAAWDTTLLDIASQNYNYDFSKYHSQHPNQSVISSESCSCTTDRNEYVTKNPYCSAYDGCPWNSVPCPDGCWKPIAQTPYIIGSFDWTGFDYKGEPTPYSWPDINSHFGVNDIVGFPKDNYFYYKSAFINMTDEIVLHILPNTWNGDTGTDPIKARVYTNCEYVELFINNKSVSNGQKQQVKPLEYYAVSIKYSPGEIKANCISSGNEILATKVIQTTNAPSKISLEWEYPYNSESKQPNTIYGDGLDVALISAYVQDNQNRTVPNANNNTITFSLDNEKIAFILGTGNGDPSCHEPDHGSMRTVFHGKARVLVQSQLNQNGMVKLTASSPGLMSDTIEINIQKPMNEIKTI